MELDVEVKVIIPPAPVDYFLVGSPTTLRYSIISIKIFLDEDHFILCDLTGKTRNYLKFKRTSSSIIRIINQNLETTMMHTNYVSCWTDYEFNEKRYHSTISSFYLEKIKFGKTFKKEIRKIFDKKIKKTYIKKPSKEISQIEFRKRFINMNYHGRK